MPGSRGRRFISFLVALIIIAWALASIPRSQPSGSWLVNSYWLLYVITFLPVLALVAMAILIVGLVYSWRSMSDVLGAGIAKKMQRRRGKTLPLMIFMTAWGIALSVLMYTCKGIPCRLNEATDQGIQSQVFSGTSAGSAGAELVAAFTDASLIATSIVQSQWFAFAFFGLLVVSSVIFARGFVVAWKEMKAEARRILPLAQQEGLNAVQEAIQIVQQHPSMDPREKVLASYKRIIRGSANMGAAITPNQTARELETTIRGTFKLRGNGIRDLTQLFEEARYSIHPITQTDSERAHQALVSIEEELAPKLSLDSR